MADRDPISPGVPAVLAEQGPPWGVLHAVLALAVSVLAQGFVPLLAGSDPNGLDDGLAGLVAGQVAGLALVLVLVWTWVGRRRSPLRTLGFRAPRVWDVLASWWILGLGALAYLGASFGLAAVMRQVGMQWEDMPRQRLVEVVQAADSSLVLVLSLAIAVVIAPVVEEVLFRSVLYQPLRHRFGPTTAALMVSLVFAGVHFYAWGAVHLVIISLVLTGLFERTRSLWVPIVAHAAYNAFMILMVRLLPVAP